MTPVMAVAFTRIGQLLILGQSAPAVVAPSLVGDAWVVIVETSGPIVVPTRLQPGRDFMGNEDDALTRAHTISTKLEMAGGALYVSDRAALFWTDRDDFFAAARGIRGPASRRLLTQSFANYLQSDGQLPGIPVSDYEVVCVALVDRRVCGYHNLDVTNLADRSPCQNPLLSPHYIELT